MHAYEASPVAHDHVFNQDKVRPGEQRTLLIVVLTAVFMIVEIVAGLNYGSMALLADGLHMASHAVALGISVAAYIYARRHAADRRFSFGTGKVNSLAAFASAICLVGFAALMVIESIQRLVTPQTIGFDQAILIAVLGLLVNGVSAWLLASTPHRHHHGHDHSHSHDREYNHNEYAHSDASVSEPQKYSNRRPAYLGIFTKAVTSLSVLAAPLAGTLKHLVNTVEAWLPASSSHQHDHDRQYYRSHDRDDHAHGEAHGAELQKDHNLRAAYLHVLADALTSLLAIAALLAGKYAGVAWLDPVMGIVGAILVAHWSWGLLSISAKVLLDWQAEDSVVCQLRQALSVDGSDSITDLHVWAIGQDQYAAEITVVTSHARKPIDYKATIPDNLGIVHVTIEIHRCSTQEHSSR